MKTFLVCNECGKEKIKFSGLKRENELMHVKLECEKCKSSEVCSVHTDHFLTWVKTPEISAAYQAFNKSNQTKPQVRQTSLW
jgi:hypothetical protein